MTTPDKVQIIFDRDHFTDYQPEIALHKVTDDAGAGFFWLSGPNPRSSGSG